MTKAVWGERPTGLQWILHPRSTTGPMADVGWSGVRQTARRLRPDAAEQGPPQVRGGAAEPRDSQGYCNGHTPNTVAGGVSWAQVRGSGVLSAEALVVPGSCW